MDLTAVINLLVPLASIFDRRHKTKYKVEVLDLREAIREEENKQARGLKPNHARIDVMSSRVRDIMALFSSDFEKQDSEAS